MNMVLYFSNALTECRNLPFGNFLTYLKQRCQKNKRKKTRGRTPNGDVPNSVRLAMAIRYFAGGDPLDIACVYKVNRSVVYESVWSIVEVINHTTALDIKYPTQHAEQRAIANEFKAKSAVGFNNCAGCLDGLLIWTHKPSDVELKQLKIGGKKFFCGRKKKFDLNMQAVCDACGRFLDVEIKHLGATSHYLAFALSRLHHKLEGRNFHDATKPFLEPGLAIYGDNAYVNTRYMVVPFKNTSSGPKDAFNFYHSQLRINIECAFGQLVHRWGILRRAIPCNISLAKTIALVMALCKLHNFCINEKDVGVCRPTPDDSFEISLNGGLDLSAFGANMDIGDGGHDIPYVHDRDRVHDLMDGGEHWDDIPRWQLPRVRNRARAAAPLPYMVMLEYVEQQGYERPSGGRKVR